MILAKTYENQYEAWKYLMLRFLSTNSPEFEHTTDYITYNGTVVSELSNPTTELPDNPVFSNNFTKQYCMQLVNGNTDTGDSDTAFVYTYHDRLCNYGGIDQINYITKELNSSPESRRAVGITWQPAVDTSLVDVPCMQWVKCLKNDDDVLNMTVLFRSHDMFLGFPVNCCGIRALQNKIAEQTSSTSGSLTVISTSAHVYKKRDMDMIRRFVK